MIRKFIDDIITCIGRYHKDHRVVRHDKYNDNWLKIGVYLVVIDLRFIPHSGFEGTGRGNYCGEEVVEVETYTVDVLDVKIMHSETHDELDLTQIEKEALITVLNHCCYNDEEEEVK